MANESEVREKLRSLAIGEVSLDEFGSWLFDVVMPNDSAFVREVAGVVAEFADSPESEALAALVDLLNRDIVVSANSKSVDDNIEVEDKGWFFPSPLPRFTTASDEEFEYA